MKLVKQKIFVLQIFYFIVLFNKEETRKNEKESL